jgi:hypothetical protein
MTRLIDLRPEPVPEDRQQWIKFDKAADIMLDSETGQVCTLRLCEQADLERFKERTNFPLNITETGVALEADNPLFIAQAPVEMGEWDEVELQAFQGVKMMAIKAIPITPGTHNGFSFSAEVLRDAPTFKGVRLVANHKFEEPAHVLGQVLEDQRSLDQMLVTALVMDPDAADRIRRKKFHSVSSHFLVQTESAKSKKVTKINSIVELTLTSKPADPNAIIVSHQEIEVPVPLEAPIMSPAGTSAVAAAVALEAEEPAENVHQGPTDPCPDGMQRDSQGVCVSAEELQRKRKYKLESQSQPTGGIVLNDENTTTGQSGAPPPQAAQLEAEVQDLKAKLEAQREEMTLLRHHQEVERVQMEVNELVSNGKITPAQKDAAGRLALMAARTEEGAKAWTEFIANNQVAPLGDVEGGSGMAANSKPSVGSLSQLSNEQLEMLNFSITMEAAEKKGMFGEDARQKHNNGLFMGLFPSGGE